MEKPKSQKKIKKEKGLTVDDRQKKYVESTKGQEALSRARKKYDESDKDRRRKQKRDYMRRKREQDPNYCKWK